MTPDDLKKLERLVGTGTGDTHDPGGRGPRGADPRPARARRLGGPRGAGLSEPGRHLVAGRNDHGLRAGAARRRPDPGDDGGAPGPRRRRPPLSADIIASIERDGPLASLLAFVGVLATVVLIFRWGIATPFVIGSLVIGVLWLLAATMWLGIKINFINFIAFPITFGSGSTTPST